MATVSRHICFGNLYFLRTIFQWELKEWITTGLLLHSFFSQKHLLYYIAWFKPCGDQTKQFEYKYFKVSIIHIIDAYIDDFYYWHVQHEKTPSTSSCIYSFLCFPKNYCAGVLFNRDQEISVTAQFFWLLNMIVLAEPWKAHWNAGAIYHYSDIRLI